VYAPASTRLIASRDDRRRTDYLFDFWTAFGWTLLTCGIYGFYVDYRLMERMRDHNRRRLAFLEATNELAWARAVEQGREDELRPRFERVAADLGVLHQLAGEFRDPAIWLLIVIFGQGVGLLIAFWLLDADLVKHGAAQADAEAVLVAVLADLGVHVDAPTAYGSGAPPKAPHNYWGRIVATIGSLGFYQLWWLADLMREANDHFLADWAWEDAIVTALG
jgi:hypothetical protein